ncbi:MAG: hypothetical protein ACYC5M_07215 [Anaerolineae bacterium]
MAFFGRTSRAAWRAKLLFLALIFLVLLTVLVSTVFHGVSAQRPSDQFLEAPRTIPNTDVNPYGANLFLSHEVEPWKREKTLRMAAEAGMGWAKQQFAWEEIEPRRKGEFIDPSSGESSWSKFDQIVEACEALNLHIVARLDRPPDWTREDNTLKQRPPDDLEDYGDFVYEFVRRYRGRIGYIQVWNEPNIYPEWGDQPVDPAGYVELLRVAYRRAKEADPNIHVICAPLAITLGESHAEPGKWRAMSDLQFLEEMYQAGAKDYFDIYAANAFGMELPPEDPPDPKVLNFQRVVLQREIMERHGDADKAIWFNEYGWNAAPEGMARDKLVWGRVSEQQQADYTVRGIELARREWPWAGVFFVWYFRQVGNVPVDHAEYYFRLVDVDFTPRPVYLALQAAAARLGPAGLGLHQETSHAISLSGAWRTAIDGDAFARGYALSETEGAKATFRFWGTDVDLVTRSSDVGGRFWVTLDGHAVAGLPVDAQGRSYVDLVPGEGQQARVPLVRGAAAGLHALTLTVAPSDDPEAPFACTLDALEVYHGDRMPFPAPSVAGLALAMSADAWLFVRTWRRARWVLRAH